VADARRAGRRLGAADGLIAATALAHDLPLYTLDAGFRGLPGLRVVGV
jgi:predicted nucleic acid-binding protein